MSSPPSDGTEQLMGGSGGEGLLNDPTQGMTRAEINPGSTNYYDEPQPQGQWRHGAQAPYPTSPPPPTPPNASYGNPPSTPASSVNDISRMGSITQYASPELMSSGLQSEQQGQPSQQQNMYASINPGGTSGQGSSFAERSAQAYAMQQPQYQQQHYLPQQQYQQPQQPIPVMEASPQPSQQQPPHPPGSFAERSAQAYAMQQPRYQQHPQFHQQPQYQQQQPQIQQQQPQYQQQQQQYQPQPQQLQYQQQQYQPQPQQQYSQQAASQFPTSAPQAPSMGASTVITSPTLTNNNTVTPTKPQPSWAETPAQVAIQNRLLTDATRKVQEHAYYMRQAMEKNDLPNVLDRASLMVGQLGENHAPSHHGQAGHLGPNAPPPGGEASQLNPKNYYELHMRALEDMPPFEEYLLTISGHGQQLQPVDPNRITITMAPSPLSLADAKFTMRELYDCVQYCPQVLPRLYLQICAGSALIQSGEVGTKWVMNDLMQATKCVQNPVRGLFLRHYLLQMVRDKLPDTPIESTPLAGEAAMEEKASAVTPTIFDGDGGSSEAKHAPNTSTNTTLPLEHEPGSVVDSYQFILANFIEMNKLWVRIQHLPGDAKTKDQRKRRERERNELRILVGTNLVRLSQLEGVTSKIYGEIILPTVLDHIVVCGDPLAQAYLIDCLTQVFPDEYHIETLPILLRVCPKLRDKVNVRTILQNLMDRLANYLADEELLDETDTNQVKMNMAKDSFPMFEECVQNVYNARGPKLGAKEVIRLQTALLSFSLRCFHGDMEQINRCLQGCVSALKQASASYEMQEGTVAEVPGNMKPLDDVSTAELEKLLSIPLNSLALKVLQLPDYGELLAFLPWNHRREVALKLLKAIDDAGTPPKSVKEIEELFGIVEPVIRDEHDVSRMMSGMGINDGYAGQQQTGLSTNIQGISKEVQRENALVSKLVHLLDHDDADVVYEMLMVARQHINQGNKNRTGQTLVAVVFATFRLVQRVFDSEHGTREDSKDDGGNSNKDGTEDKKEEETTVAENTVEEVEGAVESDGKEGGKGKDASALGSKDGTNSGEEENANSDDGKNANSKEGNDNSAEESGEPESTPLSSQKEVAGEADASSSATTKSVGCRKLFVFLQQTITMLATSNVECGFKLYLQTALTADRFAGSRKESSELLEIYGPMPFELISQAIVLYEERISDTRMQQRCIVCIMGTLLECRSLSDTDYEGLVTKTAQFSAKVMKKSDQCQLVTQCAHLFYPADNENLTYRNAQRALECLQRALKLADACTSTNSEDIYLFVDLLDHYLYFFERKCPVIPDAYITGLCSLVKEHISNLGGGLGGNAVISNARDQFLEIVLSIKEKKANAETSEHFAKITLE